MMTIISSIADKLVIQPQDSLPELLRLLDKEKQNHPKRYISYEKKLKVLKSIIEHKMGQIYSICYSNYCNELTDENINLRSMIKPTLSEKKYLTFHEAVLKFNINFSVLRNLAKHGLINMIKTKKGNREITLLEYSSLVSYEKMRGSSFYMEEVCNVLGVRYFKVKKLVEMGLLKALHGPIIDGYSIWFFEKKTVIDFLDFFLNKSQEIDEAEEDWISIGSAIGMFYKPNFDVVDILKLVQEDKLHTAVLKSKKRFDGMFISRQSLEHYLDELKETLINNFGFKPSQIAKMLKVNVRKINKWMDEGILKINHKERNKNGSTTFFVSREEVQKLLGDHYGWTKQEIDEYLKKVAF